MTYRFGDLLVPALGGLVLPSELGVVWLNMPSVFSQQRISSNLSPIIS